MNRLTWASQQSWVKNARGTGRHLWHIKLSTYGPRSFAVVLPTTWNSLPEYLCQ